jgi:peptidoglycan/xylan/chitin deacetylase (PgdA/CDA1 family)
MTHQAPIAWPGGKRCAVVLTVNFDAELFWLRLDPSVVDRPKTRSVGEYGARRGAARLLDALATAGVPSTWFVPSSIARTYPAQVAELVRRGHEVACRGEGTEILTDLGRDEQRELIGRAARELQAITGALPTGFRPFGEITEETAAVLAELGFAWSSCTRGDDRPLFLESASGATAVVDIPQHWELYDAPYFLFNYGPPFPAGQTRIASYARVLEDWKLEFDAYRAEGLCFVLTLDPQAIGTPGRIALLEELLAHITAHDDVWFATGADVGEFWRGAGRPNGPRSAETVRYAARRDGW